VILKVIALFMPLRVNEEQERQGLDLAEHGETAYSE
jgi:Amt family ammonium transporter